MINQYIIRLLTAFAVLFLITSCSKEMEHDISMENVLEQEINTRSSICDLDWGITYNNDDNDACRNVAIQVNGLTGDCANCEVLGYKLWLNTNNVIAYYDDNGNLVTPGPILIGSWSKAGISSYTFTREIFNTFPTVGFEYSSSTQFTSLANLASGEITDFDYLLGTNSDVELCAQMFIDCGSGPETHSFCQLVDLNCE
ncbi:MAG: hypothetical protein ACJATI_003146 [Halioglobus sp.]|jgi:hypothetical protein